MNNIVNRLRDYGYRQDYEIHEDREDAADYIERLEMSVRCLLYAIKAENPLDWERTIKGAEDILQGDIKPNQYYIGPLTFDRVLRQHNIHNMADIQAVMDAVEMALKNILDTA